MQTEVFERCVVLYGSKALLSSRIDHFRFERGVILYGSKTKRFGRIAWYGFERGVIFIWLLTSSYSAFISGFCLRSVVILYGSKALKQPV